MGSRRKRAKRPRTKYIKSKQIKWQWPDPPANAVLLLSSEDECLRSLCEIRPRSRHKRAGVQMWHAVMTRTLTGRKRRRRPPSVYRLIMQRVLGVRRLPRGLHVDHINGNPLDNRRENLRMATPMQNAANAHKKAGCSSIYKGVSFHSTKRKWEARLNLTVTPGRKGQRGKAIRLFLGQFDIEVDAALCYDQVAREWYGPYARLNFPEQYVYEQCTQPN